MGFEPRQDPSSLETVNEFTKRMESATEETKSAIHKAQEDMTKYYNRRRSPAPVFKPGDQVYLDASISEVVTPQTGTLRNRVPSRTVSLPTQVAPQTETVASGVQRGQVVHRPG